VTTCATHPIGAPPPVLPQPVPMSAAAQWDADNGLEQLYAQHWTGLVRLAYLLLHDRGVAEEVVQDAFVAMHATWSSLREPEKALAYLRRAVVNRARSVQRRRAVADKHLRRGLGERWRDAPDAAQPTLEEAEASLVWQALAALPRRQREVLVLRYYLDLSEAEIAQTLGLSKGSVKAHASRGSARLRTQLSAVSALGEDES